MDNLSIMENITLWLGVIYIGVSLSYGFWLIKFRLPEMRIENGKLQRKVDEYREEIFEKKRLINTYESQIETFKYIEKEVVIKLLEELNVEYEEDEGYNTFSDYNGNAIKYKTHQIKIPSIDVCLEGKEYFIICDLQEIIKKIMETKNKMRKYQNVMCVTEDELEKLTKDLSPTKKKEMFDKSKELTEEYWLWFADDEYECDSDKWVYVNGEWIDTTKENNVSNSKI